MRAIAVVLSGTIAACSHAGIIANTGSSPDPGGNDCSVPGVCDPDPGGDMTTMTMGVLGMVGATIVTYAIVHDLRTARRRSPLASRTR